MSKLGFDLDGVLLNYGAKPGEMPKANWKAIASLQGVEQITVITNQGGIPFSLVNPKFPTAGYFVDRIVYLVGALKCFGIELESLFVCVYHPKASADMLKYAVDALEFMHSSYGIPTKIFYEDQYRKPNAGMLEWADLVVYYGDSDEDQQAAETAGIDFVRVERFI